MEFRASKVIPAIILATTLTLGGTACSDGGNSSKAPQKEGVEEQVNGVTTNSPKQNQATEDILGGISRVEFFASSLEYAALPLNYRQEPPDKGEDAVNLLANRGISVTNPNTQYYGEDGPLVDTASMLAIQPCRVVEASGLERIVFVEPTVDSAEGSLVDNTYTEEPKTDANTIEASSRAEVSRSIAALLLRNMPKSQEIVETFQEITENAGVDYNPDFVVRRDIDEEGQVIPNPDFPDEYEKIFDSQESVLSPRIEFINMFSDYIYGTQSDYVDDPYSAYGQKQMLLRDFYNLLAGDGGRTLRFNGLTFSYGNHGLHPLDNVVRIRKIQDDLSQAKTEAEKDKIIYEDDFQRGLYDPDYPVDLKVPKKPKPQPCRVG